MKNRFNNLTSKEWLPFQKSWFIYKNDYKLYTENVRFFIKFDSPDFRPNLFFYSDNTQRYSTIKKICNELKINLYCEDDFDKIDNLQFAIIDIRDSFKEKFSINDYKQKKEKYLKLIYKLKDKIIHRRFIFVLMKNIYNENEYYPVSWDMAKTISSTYSLKDEKISCVENNNSDTAENTNFHTINNIFYSLYFRNDEKSADERSFATYNFFKNNKLKSNKDFDQPFSSWFILKPPPRKKNEILHPAKYPEDLVKKFITVFSTENDNIFDPMSGTGSTQLTALMNNRNGYGTELSNFFLNIANNRCTEHLTLSSDNEKISNLNFKILLKDARNISESDFPEIDYIITSPPYWNMLNMKGAEYQARRKEKGLQLNYSDDENDLGNIEEYQKFITELADIYLSLIKILKPGGFITIVVKNIKKKGSNYPFAWDLSEILQQELILLPEAFWLQDDISIAPYGYFNTYVSNTFHQYCLTFQKPFDV